MKTNKFFLLAAAGMLATSVCVTSCGEDETTGSGNVTLEVDKTEVDLAGGGDNATIEVTFEGAPRWEASADQTWLSLSPKRAVVSGKLALTATANPSSTEERVATITIKAEGHADVTVVVTQGMNTGEFSFRYTGPINEITKTKTNGYAEYQDVQYWGDNHAVIIEVDAKTEGLLRLRMDHCWIHPFICSANPGDNEGSVNAVWISEPPVGDNGKTANFNPAAGCKFEGTDNGEGKLVGRGWNEKNWGEIFDSDNRDYPTDLYIHLVAGNHVFIAATVASDDGIPNTIRPANNGEWGKGEDGRPGGGGHYWWCGDPGVCANAPIDLIVEYKTVDKYPGQTAINDVKCVLDWGVLSADYVPVK